MRGGEEERSRAVIEVVNQIARATDITSERSDGFGEGSDLHVDALSGAEVIDRAASVAAEDAACVRVVDHHDGSVLVGYIAELIDGTDISVHGEDSVGDDEFAAGLVLDFFE